MNNNTFDHLLSGAPPFISAEELVELGIYPTKSAVYKARNVGTAPPSVKISRLKIRFMKDGLIKWLIEKQVIDNAHRK